MRMWRECEDLSRRTKLCEVSWIATVKIKWGRYRIFRGVDAIRCNKCIRYPHGGKYFTENDCYQKEWEHNLICCHKEEEAENKLPWNQRKAALGARRETSVWSLSGGWNSRRTYKSLIIVRIIHQSSFKHETSIIIVAYCGL